MYILFFLMWIIFNGRITLEIVLFGVAVAAVMYLFICRFMDYSIKKDLIICKEFFYILQYMGVLLLEIVKANMATIGLIMSSKYEKEPVLVHFRTSLKTRTARVVLANSITLTPGTITVALEDDMLVVHCLDKDFAKGMEKSVFVKLLTKMEEVAFPESKDKKEAA